MILARELAGLAPLFLLLLLALFIAAVSPIQRSYASRIATVAGLVLVIQSAHVAEEFLNGFQRRFPQLLGLEAWSNKFFLTLNLTGIAIWASAILALARGRTFFAVAAPVWFLAITSFANGVAHPAVSLATGSIFPGLFSSIPLGLAGLALIRVLIASASRPQQH